MTEEEYYLKLLMIEDCSWLNFVEWLFEGSPFFNNFYILDLFYKKFPHKAFDITVFFIKNYVPCSREAVDAHGAKLDSLSIFLENDFNDLEKSFNTKTDNESLALDVDYLTVKNSIYRHQLYCKRIREKLLVSGSSSEVINIEEINILSAQNNARILFKGSNPVKINEIDCNYSRIDNLKVKSCTEAKFQDSYITSCEFDYIETLIDDGSAYRDSKVKAAGKVTLYNSYRPSYEKRIHWVEKILGDIEVHNCNVVLDDVKEIGGNIVFMGREEGEIGRFIEGNKVWRHKITGVNNEKVGNNQND
jgi:hypothetical protein